MKTALVCLVLFALWAILLVGVVISWRTLLVLRGKKEANEFASGTPHGEDWYWRLNRAHMNAVETLPVFAAIVLGGYALGADGDDIATAAQVVLGARIVQTVLHVSSGSAMVVSVRFCAFATQLGAMAAIAWFVLG